MVSRTRHTAPLAAGLLAFGLAVTPTATAATGTAPNTSADLPSYETWQSDVREVMDPSVPYLNDRVEQGGSKLAIVLDIDNTALETEYHEGAPNEPVLEFAKAAADNGVSVLIATARGEDGKSDALSALDEAGYPDITDICLKKDEDHAVDVKIRCRKEFVADGYTLIANVGNRPGDLEEKNYERGFKLPDYDEELS